MAECRLRVSDTRRYLVERDGGHPFFWLGDTAWEALHRLDREQMTGFLDNRQAKGFTVVQTVVLAEINGLDEPNAEGELPLHDCDPARPNEKYFDLVAFFIAAAAERGMIVALLPTWGAYAGVEVHPLFHTHHLFDPTRGANAYAWGRFLAERLGEWDNILWVLGGDRDAWQTGVRTWQEMARGIAEGATGREDYDALVMTYHPRGQSSSSRAFHHEPWLSFNMIQSGHSGSVDVCEGVSQDYDLRPTRPVVNGEPCYERLPEWVRPDAPKLTATDVRRCAYQSVFSGAFGHTYGAHEVWMMWEPAREPIVPKLRTPFLRADTPWHQAMDYPAAFQMGHLRRLIESRPFLTRVPDPRLIERGPRRAAATRDLEATYAMIYMPDDGELSVRMEAFGGRALRGWFFDPRGGVAHETEVPDDGCFVSPADGDWVLVLDEAAVGYGEPGASAWPRRESAR